MSAQLLEFYLVVLVALIVTYIFGRTIVSRQRQRNSKGACALCGTSLDATAAVPAGGLMMCPRCARRTARSNKFAYWLVHAAVGTMFLPALVALVYPRLLRPLSWAEILRLWLVPIAMLLLLVMIRSRLRRLLVPNSAPGARENAHGWMAAFGFTTMPDKTDEHRDRIAELERRLRVVEATLVAVALALAGFVYMQLNGSLPLRGSSLHIEAEGQPVLDVSRMVGSSVMFLWGKEQKNSVSLNAGAGGPSLILAHDPDGGSVILSAGAESGFGAFSTGREGRKLIFGVPSANCPDKDDIYVVAGDDKRRMAPVMPQSETTEHE